MATKASKLARLPQEKPQQCTLPIIHEYSSSTHSFPPAASGSRDCAGRREGGCKGRLAWTPQVELLHAIVTV